MDNDQKADYIKAVLCLQAHPAKNPVYEEAKTRFDEFQAYHIQQTNLVHLVVSQILHLKCQLHVDDGSIAGAILAVA